MRIWRRGILRIERLQDGEVQVQVLSDTVNGVTLRRGRMAAVRLLTGRRGRSL